MLSTTLILTDREMKEDQKRYTKEKSKTEEGKEKNEEELISDRGLLSNASVHNSCAVPCLCL
jgi:hypothetical protein